MSYKLKFAGLVFASFVALGFLGGKVHAAQIDIVPSTGDVACSGGSSSYCSSYNNLVMAETSYSGTSVTLNANPSWSRLSFTTASGDMRINDGCYGTTSDYPVRSGCIRSGNGIAKFDVYRTNVNGDRDTLCFSVDANDKWSDGTYKLVDGASYWFNLNSCLGAKDITTDLYGVLIAATVISPSSAGATNGYQVQSRAASGQNSFAGFADYSRSGGVPSAIQNRATPSQDPNDGSSTGIQNNFTTRMRQVCDGSAPARLHLEWQDADAGSTGSPPDSGVYWSVSVVDEYGVAKFSRTSYQEASAAGVTNDDYLGGANVRRDKLLSYTVVGGDRITWTWYNVRRTNGVQMYLHYDNNFFGAAKRCGNVHGGLVKVSCTAISGYAYDYDKISDKIRVHIFLDGNSTSGKPQSIVIADDASPVTPSPPGGAHGFTINPETAFGVSAIANGVAHKFYVYGETIDSAGTDRGTLYPLTGGNPTGTIICYPPPVNGCGAINASPVEPEVSEPFSVSPSFVTSGGDPATTYSYSMSLTISGGVFSGSLGTGTYNGSVSPVTHSKNKSSLVANTIGVYSATWTVTGPSINLSCSGTINVIRKPYVRVYNGDVFAGGTFDNNGVCGASVNADLKGRSDAGRGASGTEMAAYALGVISDFGSASRRSTPPTFPTGLSFANSPAGTLGSFGSSHCVYDYFNRSRFLTGDPRLNTSSFSTLNYPADFPTGGQTVSTAGSVTLAGGTGDIRHTLYVDGDVFISGNISYASTSWPNEASIPYFTLVVKGNIYVGSNVTRLDGVYIAQPDSGKPAGTTGRIFTCRSTGGGGRIADSDMASQCDNQLMVYGAFIADRIILQRTHGTLYAGATNEGVTANIAEVFQGTPNLYIGYPAYSTDNGLYDSIKELPPVAQ